VSPHPDDAALSLGASLLRFRGFETTVWNVFSCQSYSLIDRDATRAREQILEEEREAAAALGVRVVMGGFPEAELRGYARLSNRLGHDQRTPAARPGERDVLDRVTAALGRLIDELDPDGVGAPLGIGGHIDHLLAREAVLIALCATETTRTVFFYEELPYALNPSWIDGPRAELEARGVRLAERLVHASRFLDEKQRVLQVYRSQLRGRDVRQVIAHARSLGARGGAEKIWLVDRRN
jgi:LmbE family N-acetylglucosaminyl deacetylase